MPTQDSEGVKPLITTHEPCGCHLQVIKQVGGCFGWPSGADSFDKLLVQNHGQGDGYKGQYFTGTIVSFRDEDAKTVTELKKRGFIHLGTQDGAHGSYKMLLYGKGFTLPEGK